MNVICPVQNPDQTSKMSYAAAKVMAVAKLVRAWRPAESEVWRMRIWRMASPPRGNLVILKSRICHPFDRAMLSVPSEHANGPG